MGRIIRQIAACILVCCLAAPLAIAQESDWKVGLARVKITPPQPVFMAGYAARNKPYEQVHDDLFAKALVLEDKSGSRGVLITSDLIGFPAEIATPIRQRIAEKTGVPANSVIINSSHTHTGPTLSLDPSPRDGRASADSERTAAYTRDLADKIVQIAAEAKEKLQPAKLSWSTGVVNFVMNRREFTTDRGVILGVNPRGLADRSVPVLRIDDPAGKMIAVVCGVACHNTTLGAQDYEISGDYAGHAQRLIEEQHPGVQALFVLGCAGDANPYPRGTHEISLTHGKELAREVDRVLTTRLTPVRGPLRTALGDAALPLAPPPAKDELEKLAATKGGVMPGIAQQMLARLNRGEKLPTQYNCPLAVWQFGDDLTLVALSGEVVSDYVRMLEDALGPNRLWIAAYSNDVYGYLPSARVLREGGYETRGLIYGGVGLFAPDAQDVLVAKVRELATTVGRKLPASK
jgi:Neutral/alkaline non-lysosomal ceramidase, N-terminal